MSKFYTTFEEVENDLKRLKLERDIAFEELKLVKHEFKEDLTPANWVSSIFKFVSKYGVMLLLKRLFIK